MRLCERNYQEIAIYNLDSSQRDSIYLLKKAYHRRNILPQLREKLNAGEPVRVLEFGPGLGCLIDLLQAGDAAIEYHVADIDQGAMQALSEKFEKLTCHEVCNSSDLVQIEGAFDAIVGIDVWEHLPPEQVVEYTEWCYSRLNPGGIFILQVPNWGCPLTPATFYSDLTHQTRFNELSIIQLFKLAGISEKEVSLFPRMTPGVLGAMRDVVVRVFYFFYRMLFYLCGSVRLTLFTPDLIAVIRRAD